MDCSLNLLVIRCRDIEASKQFYANIGMKFQKEQHGKGAEHYAAEFGSLVFELYPLQDNENPDRTRLGFSVTHLIEKANLLRSENYCIIQDIQEFANELRMLVQDPDGRSVELRQSIQIG